MAQYRKKPIIIEAERWNPESFHQWPGASIPDNVGVIWCFGPDNQLAFGTIETPEGKMIVERGDWIVTGIKGEKYPVKPDIFESTYEKID